MITYNRNAKIISGTVEKIWQFWQHAYGNEPKWRVQRFRWWARYSVEQIPGHSTALQPWRFSGGGSPPRSRGGRRSIAVVVITLNNTVTLHKMNWNRRLKLKWNMKIPVARIRHRNKHFIVTSLHICCSYVRSLMPAFVSVDFSQLTTVELVTGSYGLV